MEALSLVLVLRTKSVTKIQLNKCLAEIQGPDRIQTQTPGRKTNTITTTLELGRRLIFGQYMGIMAQWPMSDKLPCYEQAPNCYRRPWLHPDLNTIPNNFFRKNPL